MKVLQINTVYPEGSTGRIASGIYTQCLKSNIDCVVACRYKSNEQVLPESHYVSSWLDCHIHNRFFQITMLQGCFSFFKTVRFLRWVSNYAPDIIHLHNIHGSYINHSLLFRYLKKHNIKVIWTLHDCWAFTGFCPYYDMVGCDKWKTKCYDCPQVHNSIDNSSFMHTKKKAWFLGVKNMTLVANSNWTASQANQSFLKNYPIKVIYNGIDLSVFKPTVSDFRRKHNCENKYVVLGVAFGWGKRKGLDVFIKLSKCLNENYKIILVGTDDTVDKLLPENITSIHRTGNQKELAEIYTSADVFVNPTREEAFGLVNIEALACGTPGITFRTGGSPECYDETCGIVVEKDDIDALKNEIIRICEKRPYTKENCINFAKSFDKYDKFQEYINLYRENEYD